MARSRVLKAAGMVLLGGTLTLRGGGLWLYERGTPDNMTAAVVANLGWQDTSEAGLVDVDLAGAGAPRDRTIDRPLARQWRYATGVQVALGANQTLGVAYTFVDLGKAPVDQSYPPGRRMAGEFESDYLHILTIAWGVKF